MNNDLYVVVGEDNGGHRWVCINAADCEVMGIDSAQALLEDCSTIEEVKEGVWKYRIAKLSFLD